MEIHKNWSEIRRIFNSAMRTSFHFAFASVDEDGRPHVTPIGSLILTRPGCGIYFEEYTRQMPANFRTKSEVCILAVNSSRWFWLKSLVLGKFAAPPALRLVAKVGELRDATEAELALWNKRIAILAKTRGGKKLWPQMARVRDLDFSELREVRFGNKMRS